MRLRGRIALFLVLLLLSIAFSKQFSKAIKGETLYFYTNNGAFLPLFYQEDQLYLRKGKKEFIRIGNKENKVLKIDPILHFYQFDSPYVCTYLSEMNLKQSTFTFLNKDKELIQEFYDIYHSPVWQSHAYTTLDNGDVAFLSTSEDHIFKIKHYMDVFKEKGIARVDDKYIFNLSSRHQLSSRINFFNITILDSEHKKVNERNIPVDEKEFNKKHILNMFSEDDKIIVAMSNADKIAIIRLENDLSYKTNYYTNKLKRIPDKVEYVSGDLIFSSMDSNILSKFIPESNEANFRSIKTKNNILETVSVDKYRSVVLTSNESRDFIRCFNKDKDCSDMGIYYPSSFKDLMLTKNRNYLIYQEQLDENKFKIYRKKIF